MQRLLLLFFVISLNLLKSQDAIEPVKWNFSYEVISDSTIALKFEAKIEDNWHMYSQFIENEPPLSTMFLFEEEPYSSILKVSEGESIISYDPIFEKDLKYFEKNALFEL
jgi:hypothetical protein